MPVTIQPAGRRLNHAVSDRVPVHLNGFFGPNHAIDPIEPGVTHGDAKAFGYAELFSLLTSLVPDVHPDASPRVERNRLETATRFLMYSATEDSLPSSLVLAP